MLFINLVAVALSRCRYYRGAKAAVIVFDVTKENAFDRIEYFRNEVLQYADPEYVSKLHLKVVVVVISFMYFFFQS
jgi:hypothetical protein